jgi:hypothetical protein
MTDEELRKNFAAIAEEMKERFNSVGDLVSAVAAHTDQRIDDLREDMKKRFDGIEQRIDSLVSRLDRVETNLGAVILQTTGFNKSLADHDRLIQGALATQGAQQKAFEAVVKQLREHKHGNGSVS